MRKSAILVVALFVMCLGIPTAHADDIIQSVLLNINGTTYLSSSYASAPGVVSTLNNATGVGTITLTFNPGPGSYNVDIFIDPSLSAPFYNEFGSTTGASVAGQSWEIGDSYAGTIYGDVLAGGTLPNANNLPGGTSNFLNTCSGPSCNGDFAEAMGFNFTLAANQEEVLTFNSSATAPGSGFYITDTHPVDPGNAAAQSLYFNGNAVTQSTGVPPPPPPPGVPEPNTLVLAGAGLLCLVVLKARS
jgi:PEP-CTERM motif-containing protein